MKRAADLCANHAEVNASSDLLPIFLRQPSNGAHIPLK